MPAAHNLNMYAGDSYLLSYTFYSQIPDPDHPGQWIKGDPLDFTGATAKSEMRLKRRTSADGEPPVISFEIANAPLGEDGRIDLELSAADTEILLTKPKLVWDLQVTYADGTVTTYVTGDVSVAKDVTAAQNV